MQATFNINGLIPIKNTNPNPNAAPMRHVKDSVFRISQTFFTENRLDLYGLNLHRSQDGKVYVEICEEDKATLMKTRKGSTSKGQSFTSHPLKGFLNSPDGQDYDFTLVHTDEQNNRKFFEVTAKGEANPEQDANTSTIAEDEAPAPAAPAASVSGSAQAAVRPANPVSEDFDLVQPASATAEFSAPAPAPTAGAAANQPDDLLI